MATFHSRYAWVQSAQQLWVALILTSILGSLWNVNAQQPFRPLQIGKMATTILTVLLIWSCLEFGEPDPFITLCTTATGLVSVWSGLINRILERMCEPAVRWLKQKCTDNRSIKEKQFLISWGYLFFIPYLAKESAASNWYLGSAVLLSLITIKTFLMLEKLKSQEVQP